MLQEERRLVAPDQASALDAFLANLDACIATERDFTLVLDDPAGNSYVERPDVRDAAELREERYERSWAQAESIGLSLGADGASTNTEVMVAAIENVHVASPLGQWCQHQHRGNDGCH